MRPENYYSVADLLRVMERLRDPEAGCPWDIAQDFRSIAPSTLEECYELIHAIEHEDYPHVGEELGDVLFQVIFYAQLGNEQGLFAFADIVDTLTRKLLRRHPHVFADGDIESRPDVAGITVAEVKHNWEAVKQQERVAREQGGVMDDVPLALPALTRAQKLQKRASRVNFDWQETGAVLAKVEEELAELRMAMVAGEAAGITEELGDLLFSCVNLSRHLGIDAEAALRGSSGKFETRFRQMEDQARAEGLELGRLTAEELDRLWRSAKATSQ
jgi:ATP diphosphatase